MVPLLGGCVRVCADIFKLPPSVKTTTILQTANFQIFQTYTN